MNVSSVSKRVVEPELLDSLAPSDPAAVRSRAELRHVNWWMGNARHVTKAILNLPEFPRRIVEIGAGDGTFMLGVARRLASAGCKRGSVALLDMEPVVRAETLQNFQHLGWQVTVIHRNLIDWLDQEEKVDLILANLFLHHFQDDLLTRFFSRFAEITSAVIACEPRRWKPALFGCRLLGLIGCNHVTRHDAVVSVRAGFREGELRRSWPVGTRFEISDRPAGLASHLFSAVRQAH